jgi:FKBP-type peptidyl-prolyl cis-trans isomerase SlyD
MSTIADATVVEIEYILRTDGGEVLDQSGPGEPLSYLHGAQNIVPGLESALTGRAVGDELTVHVAPADAYGERMDDATRNIPRTAFPPRMHLQQGAQLVLADESGRRFPVWIAEVGADSVVVDMNHPLAGTPLNFQVKVVSVRAASEEELAHGHPHGPGGHHHH